MIKDGVCVIGGEDYHSQRFLQDVHALDLETLTWSQPATAGSAGGGRIRAAAVGSAWRTAPRSRAAARARPRRGHGELNPATTSS